VIGSQVSNLLTIVVGRANIISVKGLLVLNTDSEHLQDIDLFQATGKPRCSRPGGYTYLGGLSRGNARYADWESG